MAAKKILMFYGSTREGRMVERVGKFLQAQLKSAKPEYNIEVIDPKVLNLPVLVQPAHFYQDQEKVPAILKTVTNQIKSAHGFMILTPEYNRQLPPALTNTINHFFPPLYAYKAAAIVSYSMGPGGGILAAHQARNFMVEFGAVPASFMLQIGLVHKNLGENGECTDKRILNETSKMIGQFDWWLRAANDHRTAVGIPDS